MIAHHYRRHRHQEFLRFLKVIDAEVPPGLEPHLVLDDDATHKTPKVKKWLIRHPRFHLYFTPTGSSWLNLVERWFAEPTNRKLRRSAHRSVVEAHGPSCSIRKRDRPQNSGECTLGRPGQGPVRQRDHTGSAFASEGGVAGADTALDAL